MLLTVAIDPDVGGELAERRPGRSLVRELGQRCLVTVDSTDSLTRLIDAIGGSGVGGAVELHHVVAQLMANGRLTVGGPRSVAPVPLDRVETAADVATWRELARLLLVSGVRAEVLADAGTPCEPEVCSLPEAADSEAFEWLGRQWARVFGKDTPRAPVWTEVFRPLARHSRTVFAVDGYFVNDVLRRAEGTRTRQLQGSGGLWFLWNLSRDSTVRHVHVACSADSIRDRHDLTDALDRVRALAAEIAPNVSLDLRAVRGRFDHGRRLAFDGWAGFELHKGLASFDGETLRETTTVHASTDLAAAVRKDVRRLAG